MQWQQFVSPATQVYELPAPFELASGEALVGAQVAYRTWGQLNDQRDNAVLVCHALTGWADADLWWEPLLGPGRALDPDRDFIICSNILGSCYGTTGPTSTNPVTGVPYGPNFPAISVRDMVKLQAILLDALGVGTLALVIGGSLGGMQVLEWAVTYPERVRAIAPMACSGRHSAWCIGLGEAQRQAIYADPNWCEGFYPPDRPPARGLAVARMMAMSTYRSWTSFETRFGRQVQPDSDETRDDATLDANFAIVNYLRHHGQKLVERFDASTYVALTQAMDRHDVGRGRSGGYPEALRSIQQPALVVGIDSDILYPPHEQQEIAALMSHAHLEWLSSNHGHDAFLINTQRLNRLVLEFRDRFGIYSTFN